MFMEDSESSKGAKCMSILIMSTIIISIVAFNLQTLPQLRDVVPGEAWYLLEVVCTIVFTIEYVVRLSVCTEGGITYRKWVAEPGNLCDFLAIVPFYVELFQQRFYVGATQAFKSLRLVRLFRLFRIFKLGRYSSGMQLMFQTIRNSGQALTLLVFLLSVLVFVFGTALFFFERFSCPYRDQMPESELALYDDVCLYDQGYLSSGKALDSLLCCDKNSRALDFANIAHACWLAIVTMTTVGYGDKYPKTVQGSFIGVSCMFSGILLIALPTAIVGQNFQEVYQQVLIQQKRLKRKSSKQFALDAMSAISPLARKSSKNSVVAFDSPISKNPRPPDARNPRSQSPPRNRIHEFGSRNPQAVYWKRLEIISERSKARSEQLKGLQLQEQTIQERLKSEIRNLVQILEAHPLGSESVT
jgi:hypothetical protein